jgi:hypothetical protein
MPVPPGSGRRFASETRLEDSAAGLETALDDTLGPK